MSFVILGDEAFALSQHTTILYHKFWCCLTRRMVECAFGIVLNKWRIFHRAIDVCPDFCDVIVKTCCIPYSFVRQRDGFQFQDALYEWPLESRLLTQDLMWQKRPWENTVRHNSLPTRLLAVRKGLKYCKHGKCLYLFRTNTAQHTTKYVVLQYIHKVSFHLLATRCLVFYIIT
jgi:hypothetical protein